MHPNPHQKQDWVLHETRLMIGIYGMTLFMDLIAKILPSIYCKFPWKLVVYLHHLFGGNWSIVIVIKDK